MIISLSNEPLFLAYADMTKTSTPPPYGPPPAAPPSYAQAVGGVPPTSPFIPHHSCKYYKMMQRNTSN